MVCGPEPQVKRPDQKMTTMLHVIVFLGIILSKQNMSLYFELIVSLLLIGNMLSDEHFLLFWIRENVNKIKDKRK